MVKGDLQNNASVGDTWSPTASTNTLKKLLENDVKKKSGAYQLKFIGSFLQAKVKIGYF